MISRTCERTIRRLLRGFPIVTLTGPRQSGKTTLARSLFTNRPYVSLEDPDTQRLAMDDPRSFLDRFPNGGVLDEVQRCPALFSYLQTRVDTDGRMGRFILTGSQQFGLLAGISQSLAGRSAFVELLPFSTAELADGGKLVVNLDKQLLTGCYPPLYDRKLEPAVWFAAYVTAYIERDVRQLVNVQDLNNFQRFVRLCAGRSGQLLNLSALATECGITHNTAKAWISVLEASYVVFLLRPHHANLNKRLVKTPKLYFHDVGLAAWLLGIRTAEQLTTHPLRGHLFESFIIADLLKTLRNKGETGDLYFWRDSNGVEVDVIVERGNNLIPIEIKAGKTVHPESFGNLERWLALAGSRACEPTLVYAGKDSYRHRETTVVGWQQASTILA
jgi:predicted AAA+ superfamily ATPase